MADTNNGGFDALFRRYIEQAEWERQERDRVERGLSPHETDSWKNPPDIPPHVGRRLQVIEAPHLAEAQHRVELSVARSEMAAHMLAYLEEPAPEHMLLVRALPGVGKTTAAIRAVEEAAADGRRVVYFGPRHDFFEDVLAITKEPRLWYEWLPRQAGDAECGRCETCVYATEIGQWLARGYEAMLFCSTICGWDYVNKQCRYHEQKRRREPCIFAQHLHSVLGHPLEFDVAIGDEYVMPAFVNDWRIPNRWITPGEMDPREPLTEVLYALRKMTDDGVTVEGGNLLTLLGGAEHVRDACEGYYRMAGSVIAPTLRRPEDVVNAPYNHLPSLVPLLAREARAFLEYGDGYPHRIQVKPDGLRMLLRNSISAKVPPHLIWLDGTGDPRLYREVFDRPVDVYDARPELKARIYQLYERSNGKSFLLDQQGRPTSKADQARALVRRIIEQGGYERPAIISFKGIVASEGFDDMDHGHFYAARGTNAFEDADCLIVLGTPQPTIEGIQEQAKMLFFDRDKPFASEWGERLVPYSYVDEDGKGRAYPCSGFWGDPDLQAVLNSVRESEIVQAAHRCRPVHNSVDIWLLTNLPIDQLPPVELLSLREVMGAPVGVNVFIWKGALDKMDDFLRQAEENGLAISVTEFAERGNVDPGTAKKYMQALVDTGQWVWDEAIRPSRPGPRPRAIRWGRNA